MLAEIAAANAAFAVIKGALTMKDWLIAFVAAVSLIGLTIWTARVVLLTFGV